MPGRILLYCISPSIPGCTPRHMQTRGGPPTCTNTAKNGRSVLIVNYCDARSSYPTWSSPMVTDISPLKSSAWSVRCFQDNPGKAYISATIWHTT